MPRIALFGGGMHAKAPTTSGPTDRAQTYPKRGQTVTVHYTGEPGGLAMWRGGSRCAIGRPGGREAVAGVAPPLRT
jgi:hypothetical protein